MKESFITFEYKGRICGIAASKLSAAEREVPFVEYPGLPAGVCGVVLWGGKILPVITDDKVLPGSGTFLVCKSKEEFVLYTRSRVKVIPVESEKLKQKMISTALGEVEVLDTDDLFSPNPKGSSHAA